MNEEKAKKLLSYVSSMVEHYDCSSYTIQSELKERGTKVDQAINSIHSSVVGKAFCDECDNKMMKDEIRNERYCPRCG